MLSCMFIAALWSPAGKGLTIWLSCMWWFLVFCHFPIWCHGSGMHARIQEFSSGGVGVGGSRSVWYKKLWQCFFFFFFFLVLSLFYRSQMVNFREIYHFSRFQRGSNIFQRGSNFFLLVPYRNPYNLWFSRGGGPDPLSPLWIRTWVWYLIVSIPDLCLLPDFIFYMLIPWTGKRGRQAQTCSRAT